MNEQDELLNQLWQQQPTESPDVSKLKKQWRMMHVKQWTYAILDILSLVFVIGVYIYAEDKFDPFMLSIFQILLPFTTVVVAYLLWLRRHALKVANSKTQNFIQHLKRQVKNNIKIARLNELTSLWLIPIVIAIHGTAYFNETWEYTVWLKKTKVTLLVHGILIPTVWTWANRRKKRFQKELAFIKEIEK